jgi:hypothetical protein
MAIVPMAEAVAGQIASSTEYNKIIDNIVDLDTRLTGIGGTRYNMERRLNASTSITNGSNQRVPFDTSILAGSGITYTGGTTRSFTLTNAGVYMFSTSIRLDGPAEAYLWIAPTANGSLDHAKTATASGPVQLGTSSVVRSSAGQAWSVWMWLGTTRNLVRENSGTNAPWVKIEYIGPL